LGRGIHRSVRGLLDHMKSLEMHTHRMGRVGEPAMKKGIGLEQITEFIVGKGFGDGYDGEQDGAYHERQHPHQEHRGGLPARESAERSFRATKPIRRELGICEGDRDRRHEPDLDTGRSTHLD